MPIIRKPRTRAAAVAVLAIALAAAPRLAAQPPALTLGDVYREMRDASPRLRASAALARAARSRVSPAGLPPDPQLQVGWMNYALPSLAPMEPLGMRQLQLMQMLPLGGKLPLARGVAESRALAQEERTRDAWYALRSEAAMAFYDVYRADRALDVMRETLRLLVDIRRTTEAMYRVGEGRQADVLRAQVEIARMTEDTLRMQAMRDGAWGRLAALLDRGADSLAGSPALPAFPAALPTLESLDADASAGRPMLRAGEREVEAASTMGRLARRELLPDLQVGVQYGQRRAAMPATDAMGEATVARRTERMGSLMLGVTLPVFARGRQLEQREEAEAMRQMAVADLAAMRAETRGALRVAHAELTRARRLSALYRGTILPQAQATLASALSAYRAGQVDFMTLLDGQMSLNRYRQELHALEADEGTRWAELEMLTGRELLDAGGGAPVVATGGGR